MSTTIAFLSGKGGSGKTTLSLSIADLLCKSGIQTLLVDCDLSTNGATYFYESRMIEQNEDEQIQIFSFSDLLYLEEYSIEQSFMEIETKLHFIPSISALSEINAGKLAERSMWRIGDSRPDLRGFVKQVRNKYDVILFDCQAGYTDILSQLLPLMDANLFVLEADSISASAMRSLHLKIGNLLGNAKLYQVFNKTTQEEFDIYSKIDGTFFTNIGTLLFDWKIRQAFSRSQVPDIESTSSKYGSDLCDICMIILHNRAVRLKLEHFSSQLHYQKLEDERNQIVENMYKLANPKKLKIIWIVMPVVTLIIFMLLDYLNMHNYLFSQNSIKGICIATVTLTISANLFDFFSETFDGRQKNRRKLKDIEKRLKEMNDILKPVS